MGKRYGRNRRRQHRAKIAVLERTDQLRRMQVRMLQRENQTLRAELRRWQPQIGVTVTKDDLLSIDCRVPKAALHYARDLDALLDLLAQHVRAELHDAIAAGRCADTKARPVEADEPTGPGLW